MLVTDHSYLTTHPTLIDNCLKQRQLVSLTGLGYLHSAALMLSWQDSERLPWKRRKPKPLVRRKRDVGRCPDRGDSYRTVAENLWCLPWM